METNYISRDTYGMYKNTQAGPGPSLMGADTHIGKVVYNTADESFGTINNLLKSAPGFEKDHGPAMAGTGRASDVHQLYGVKTTGRVQ